MYNFNIYFDNKQLMAIMVGREFIVPFPSPLWPFFLYLVSNNLYALLELDVVVIV